jgi:hypothetical protein
MPTIAEQLATLADLQGRLAAVAGEHAARRLQALPPPVRQRLCALDAAYAPEIAALELAIKAQTTEVKAAVLAHGHSVQGHGLHAVFMAGRVSWDDHALQGYAVVHPEILPFRTQGALSVSIRQGKGGGDGA